MRDKRRTVRFVPGRRMRLTPLAGRFNLVKANVNATVESLKAMPVYERAGE